MSIFVFPSFSCARCGLAASPKLHGNIGLDNRHAVHLLLSLLLRFQLLVLAEVLDIFRVRQVFLTRVLVVVFLPVVDFVFVLIVAVVARAVAEIRQRETLPNSDGVFCVRDRAAAIRIEELEDFVHSLFFRRSGDGACGLVFQAVGFGDVVARPLVAAVVVVQVEEGAGVEGVDVVLLWNACVSPCLSAHITTPLRLSATPHQPCVGLPSLHRALRVADCARRALVCRRRRPRPGYLISRALLLVLIAHCSSQAHSLSGLSWTIVRARFAFNTAGNLDWHSSILTTFELQRSGIHQKRGCIAPRDYITEKNRRKPLDLTGRV
jgi:hypothetical protein